MTSLFPLFGESEIDELTFSRRGQIAVSCPYRTIIILWVPSFAWVQGCHGWHLKS
jgi:hypothetical protein